MIQRFDLASVSCARRVISQAQELAKLGHEVTLVDMPHPKRQAEIGRTQENPDFGVPIVQLQRGSTAIFRNLAVLNRLPRPDVVHLWKSYPDASIPALLYAWSHRIPLHYDWDDWEEGITLGLTGCQRLSQVVLRWERALCRWADGVSVASQALRQAALEWGCPGELLTDLPVGVDSEKFYPRPADPEIKQKIGLTPPILLYLGQLEVESYVLHCVDVLRTVKQSIPDASLLVIGGGRLQQKLLQSIRSYHLETSCFITGYVDADEVPLYLSVGDVALSPFVDNQVTRCKSPLKIAEYAAMGLPVVASDVGEARTMLKQHVGKLVPPDDSGAMAQGVIELLNHPAPRFQTVPDGLTWQRHAEKLSLAYQHLI